MTRIFVKEHWYFAVCGTYV